MQKEQEIINSLSHLQFCKALQFLEQLTANRKKPETLESKQLTINYLQEFGKKKVLKIWLLLLFSFIVTYTIVTHTYFIMSTI